MFTIQGYITRNGITNEAIRNIKAVVPAQLICLGNPLETDISQWDFYARNDKDYKWYEEKRDYYEKAFRAYAKEIFDNIPVLDGQDTKLLQDTICFVKNGLIEEVGQNAVILYCNGTVIQKLTHNSCIVCAEGDTIITSMEGCSTVERLAEKASIVEVGDNAVIKQMTDKTAIGTLYGNAFVGRMSRKSIISEMCDCSTVAIIEDQACIREMSGFTKVLQAKGLSEIMSLNDFANVES